MSEIEYLKSLKEEKHLYKWCMVHVGNKNEAEAERLAEEFYKYEPPSSEYRELVFHDEAWHWAMLKLKGEQYWVKYPELLSPSDGYQKESEMFGR